MENPFCEEICGPQFEYTSLYAGPGAAILPQDRRRIVDSLRHQQTELLQFLVHSADRSEFCATRRKLARRYWQLSQAIQHLLNASLDQGQWSALARDSMNRLRRDFTTTGPARFGGSATEEVLFALATLTRVPRLLTYVVQHPLTDTSSLEEERPLITAFLANTLICELHLHILAMLLYSDEEPIREHVLAETLWGLRTAVRLYGALACAAKLRRGPSDAILDASENVPLDQEDRALLNASAADAARMLSSIDA
jgi:hypothetical protein